MEVQYLVALSTNNLGVAYELCLAFSSLRWAWRWLSEVKLWENGPKLFNVRLSIRTQN
jgi:hypothetical protein